MADADQLVREGDIDGARTALVDLVRSDPGNAQVRMFLFQLLALSGEWDKAQTQLRSLASLSPDAAMLSASYGAAIDGERQRAQALGGEGEVAVLVRGGDWIDDLAQSWQLLASGDLEAAQAVRDRAFDAAPDMPGTFNDTKFDWIADSDSRFGPAIEAIVHGRWGLIGFDAIDRIESAGPRDLRDLVWYPVQVGFKSGQSAAAMIPSRYPGTERSTDGPERLARATNWRDWQGAEAGFGQRLFSLSSGEEQGILALRTLTFD